MVVSIVKSEIKKLGYVIDFEIFNSKIYAINNVGRLLAIDKNFNDIGKATQNGIGSQIGVRPASIPIDIIFSNGKCVYEKVENQCIPVKTKPGLFGAIS